jgi:hypothetical protein
MQRVRCYRDDYTHNPRSGSMGDIGIYRQPPMQNAACSEGAGVKGFRCFESNWINQQIRDNKRLRMLVPRVYGLGDLSEILDERAYTQASALLNSMREDLSKGGCPTLRGFRRVGFRQLTL